MTVKIKKTDPSAATPSYKHKGEDACFDLSILIDKENNWPFHYTEFGDKLMYDFHGNGNKEDEVIIPPNYSYVFHTGLKAEIENGYVMRIYVRSSTGIKKGLVLSNGTGIIDSNYRGEIMLSLSNISSKPMKVAHLDRVAQAEIAKVIDVDFIEADELSETTRGEGGIGSTGSK